MCTPFLYLPSPPLPVLVLAFFIVFKAKWERNFGEIERESGERVEVVVGLTGLFMGIDFNLQ